MSFKSLFGLTLFAALFVISCARESAPSNPAIEVKLKGDGECLSQFGDHINRYLTGRMSRPEVIEFWDCTAQSVREYQRLTAGDAPQGGYTPQALRRFLYRYFIKTKPLDDTVLAHVMELKRVLLSGSVSEITREELSRLNTLIVELKLLSLEIHPHVLVLFANQPASDAQVDQAARAFEGALQRVGGWLDSRRESYSFHQLKGLLADLNQFEAVAELLPAAKQLLLSGAPDQIEGREWLALTRLGGQGFRIFLNFRQAFRHHLNEGLSRELMPDSLDTMATVFAAAIRQRGTGGLPLQEWDRFFERLEHTDLLPKGLSAEALKGAFRWLVIRALGGGQQTTDLSLRHVIQLREHANIWREIHRRELGQKYNAIPEIPAFDEIIVRSVPMQWDAEGRLVHAREPLPEWSENARRQMVWPFALLNWLKSAYIGSKPQMSEDEIALAVSEVLPMLQKFGWMTQTKLTVGKRILREADLFTNASNGDFELDLSEATRYLAFVASGFRVAEIWLEEADRRCNGREATCVRELATRPDSRALESLPHLRAAVLKGDPALFIKYMKQSEETVLGQVTVGPMSTKNILQTWQLFQYVETFLAIYDADHGETIGLPEAGPAFDRYGPTLAKLLRASHMPQEEIWAFFTFMMKYGDTPFGMFGGQILFNHWKWHRNDWVFQAERQTLMGILNQLSKL